MNHEITVGIGLGLFLLGVSAFVLLCSILPKGGKIPYNWAPDPSTQIEALGYGKSHPENICGRCGGPNITWFVNNSIWNRVTDNVSGILCPICFVKMAEAKGYDSSGWKISPEYLLPEDRETKDESLL